MTDLDITDVVRKLVGPIVPVGESSTDVERLRSLKLLIDVTDRLIGDIDRIREYQTRTECSMRQAGQHAATFLKRLEEAGR